MSPNWVTSTREISAEVLRGNGIKNLEEVLDGQFCKHGYPTVCRYDMGNLLVKSDIQRRLERLGYPADVCSSFLDGIAGRVSHILPREERAFKIEKLKGALNGVDTRSAIDILNHIFEFREQLAATRHPKGPEVTPAECALFLRVIGDSMMNPIAEIASLIQFWNKTLQGECGLEFLHSTPGKMRMIPGVDPRLLLSGAEACHRYLLAYKAH